MAETPMTRARMSKLRAAILFRRRTLWRERRGVRIAFASSSTESSDEVVIARPRRDLAPLSLDSLYSDILHRSMYIVRSQNAGIFWQSSMPPPAPIFLPQRPRRELDQRLLRVDSESGMKYRGKLSSTQTHSQTYTGKPWLSGIALAKRT